MMTNKEQIENLEAGLQRNRIESGVFEPSLSPYMLYLPSLIYQSTWLEKIRRVSPVPLFLAMTQPVGKSGKGCLSEGELRRKRLKHLMLETIGAVMHVKPFRKNPRIRN
uniref:Uncharacterized protein n=1 Tax=Daucus carota subsp. sativus TaxID=79200 RepID=A0A164TF86_DAUCS